MKFLDSTPFRLVHSATPDPGSLHFLVPPELEASEPPEARGLARDQVRLMVSYRSNNHVTHTQFRHIGDFLQAGDLLVINTSGTMNAALHATRSDGMQLEVHLSTHLPADLWIVEARQMHKKGTMPFYNLTEGETLHLDGGAEMTIHTPYSPDARKSVAHSEQRRLWIATLQLPSLLEEYLAIYGFPIRYNYVKESWPIEYYRSVYTTEVGSAEIPSAGRAFTAELITKLVAQGIQIVPLLLHTGVSSLESHEPPYEEFYHVPQETALQVNRARLAGRRVIAVGTTVVRALETVTDSDGNTHPGEGWTRVVVIPQRGIHAVNALLTGLHEPQATHLLMLEALADREHLRIAYNEALREQYLWHEFGDLHLLLP